MDGSRERDQALERLLRQSRQSLQTPQAAGVTDACLDAETLAAWVDGGLSGAALEVAQSHVADCARCQMLVGTLARIDSVAPQAEPHRTPHRWLAWLVPLTAATAALALWVAAPRDQPAQETRLAQAPEVQRPAAEMKAKEPAAFDDRSQAPRMKDERQLQAVPGDAKNDVAPAISPPRPEAPEARTDAGRLEADSLQRQAEPPGANAPSAAAAPAAAAPTAAAAPPALAEKVLVAPRAAERRAEGVGLEILSPDPSVRWRVAGSTVQRSTNGGASWEAASTGVAADFTAGAAPSASVCWLVGRGGVVLLTTDGRTWRRIAFPDATDLSAVRATDARAASVTTADGRTFSTTDGGVTWAR